MVGKVYSHLHKKSKTNIAKKYENKIEKGKKTILCKKKVSRI